MERLKGMVAFVIAVVLLTAGAWRALVARDFVRHATVAEGVVYATPHGGSHPAVRFAVPAGEQVEYPQGGMIFGYAVGDRVKVLYLPEAPRDTACIDSMGALWFTPLILIFLGLGFGVAGAGNMVQRRPPDGHNASGTAP